MIELLTPAEMGEADRLAIAGGVAGAILMQAAGEAVAARAARMMNGGAVAVLCGPGNNGGDGYVAARLLREDGADVRVYALGDPGALKGDARGAFEGWRGRVADIAALDLSGVALVVDALFGAGLARDLDGAARDWVERVNAWRRAGGKVLAVDVPSGVDGADGAVRGAAMEADATVTFFRLKPGHLLAPGRFHCGAIECADIGIAASVLDTIRPNTFANRPALWRAALRPPRPQSHKYARGHAVAVSGGLSFAGAARLAARGALRAGAGLVTVASPREALAVNAGALGAIMVRESDGPRGLASLLSDARKNAVVMGPGLGVGEATSALVETALAPCSGRAVVLDADALTSFAGAPQRLFDAIASFGEPVALTPHDGEFARLFAREASLSLAPASAGRSRESKPSRARRAAALSRAIVVHKGPDTVVAHPDGRASIADNAPAWLATAGSGDTLAGMIAGLAAQGMPMFEAASAAVWMHGEAARLFGPGLIAEDISETLPRVWAQLLA